MRESGRLYLDVRYPHFWDTAKGWGPPGQALFPGLEILYSEGNTISLFRRVPSTKPSLSSGFILRGVLHLLLILPPTCSTTFPHHRWDHQAKVKHISPSSSVPLCLSHAIPRSPGF